MKPNAHRPDRLPALLDGEASPAEAAELVRHLRDCGECRRVLTPGGTAFFQVYNRISWLNALSRVMKVGLEHQDAPVIRMYSPREFAGLLGGFSGKTYLLPRSRTVTGEKKSLNGS